MTNRVVHCSHCDTGVKIKAEHHGKRLRCPRCSKVFVAALTEHATTAAPTVERGTSSRTGVQEKEVRPRPAARGDSYDDNDFERPRKRRRKKKQKSSPVLMWSLIAAGGVVLIGVAIALFLLLGNGREPTPAAQENPPAPNNPNANPIPIQNPNNPGVPPIPPPIVQPQPKSRLVRAFSIAEVRHYMRVLGQAYASYCLFNNKAPANIKALRSDYGKVAKIDDMLTKGYWIFYYNVRPQQMTQGASNTILAHEAFHDTNGQRVVLFGSGRVDTVDEEKFQKMPKAGK